MPDPCRTCGRPEGRGPGQCAAAADRDAHGSRPCLCGDRRGACSYCLAHEACLARAVDWPARCAALAADLAAAGHERLEARERLERAIRERDYWQRRCDELMDPIVRAKMLEPLPPIVLSGGANPFADLAAARGLCREAADVLREYRGPIPRGMEARLRAEGAK